MYLRKSLQGFEQENDLARPICYDCSTAVWRMDWKGVRADKKTTTARDDVSLNQRASIRDANTSSSGVQIPVFC